MLLIFQESSLEGLTYMVIFIRHLFADIIVIYKQSQFRYHVLLILKTRDISVSLRAKRSIGHFQGYFEGAETFLTPKLS